MVFQYTVWRQKMKRNKSLGRALLSVVVAIAMLGTGITILNTPNAAAAPGYSSQTITPDPIELLTDSAVIEGLVFDPVGTVVYVNYTIEYESPIGTPLYTYTGSLTNDVGNHWTVTVPASTFNLTDDNSNSNWRFRLNATNATGGWTLSSWTDFDVVDTTAPTVTYIGTQGFCVGDTWNLTVNATDPSGIITVRFWYKDSSGSYGPLNIPHLSGDTYVYTAGSAWVCGDVGDFINITRVEVQDGENNWATLFPNDNKTVEDCTDPVIGTPTVTQNTTCYLDAWVNITVDVTDNCNVGTVQLNVTVGPYTNPAMTQLGATNTYYVNMTGFGPGDVGTHIFHVYATDVNGNDAEGGSGSFVIDDNYGPTIGIPTYIVDLELCNDQNISVTVSDDVAGVCQVNVTFVGGPYAGQSFQMTGPDGALTGTWYYNFHPMFPDMGQYDFIIEAWDCNGTANYASSLMYTFWVNDTTDPTIVDVWDTSPIEYCTDITIYVDAY
ncbi:MAG: hypothetical protein DRN07_07265, partial [Thermoplasmata archaeon]